MALVVKDRVRETTTTTGTGTITLGGALPGFQTFAAIGDGNTTYYTISLPGANEWEVGIGTYTSSGTTLSRDTVLASSNSGSAVNFSAGTKDVFVTYPAGKSIYQDASGNTYVPNLGTSTASTGTFTTLIGGGGSANYGQLTGGATTKAIEFKAIGSDTNVAVAIRSQGTGAVNLAPGSSGVNVSNGGTVTGITRTAGGSGYTVAPTVTISAPTTAGGVQATATCTITAGVVDTTFTITNAGSGYVEQPTVSFSGGGGAGAAAYATVGGTPVVRSLGTNMSFFTPGGEQARILDSVANPNGYVFFSGGASGDVSIGSNGSATNLTILYRARGALANHRFFSNDNNNEQFRIAGTASAVNYVQVTGAATSSDPTFSAQGSDSSINLTYLTKGTSGEHRFSTSTGGNTQFRITHTGGAANYIRATGAIAGAAPSFASIGSDTNIDLALQAKGTGYVKVNAGTGLGYGTGAGGAVTQATSRTTGVTLNFPSGAITLVSAAGSTSWQTFTVTNSAVAATDTIVVNQKSGTDLYQIFITNVAAGSFKISFATTGGTTTEQPVFNFAVLKAVTS